ncbi:MAG: hypothetical protein GX595_05415 [Lentisphaerae bacterium]|nr:hypothetical protein [Lentisphaerota bacterium]
MTQPEPWYQYIARHTGMSERAVQRYAAIGHALDPAAADRLRGTPFENRLGEIEALSRQAPDEQRQIAELLTRQEDAVGSVAEALAIVKGHAPSVSKTAAERLVGRWRRMKKADRRARVMELTDEQAEELAELLDERSGQTEENA